MARPGYYDYCDLPGENDGDYYRMAMARGERSHVLFRRAAVYSRLGWPAGILLRQAAKRVQQIEKREKERA